MKTEMMKSVEMDEFTSIFTKTIHHINKYYIPGMIDCIRVELPNLWDRQIGIEDQLNQAWDNRDWKLFNCHIKRYREIWDKIIKGYYDYQTECNECKSQ